MPFYSSEILQFAKKWKFSIVTSNPYYPKSNGLVEKAIRIFKSLVKKAGKNKQDVEVYLLNYHNAPVARLTYSPSQLLNSRHLRTKLPLNEQVLMSRVFPENILTQMKENKT